MAKMKNLFEEKPLEIDDYAEADRVGARIRRIRIARNISLGEISEKLNMMEDTYRKYENGQRKPKEKRLKQIADILGVSSLALTDPTLISHINTMYALFELEITHGLEIIQENGEYYLHLRNDKNMRKYLQKWYEEKQFIASKKIDSSEEEKKKMNQEYNDWKWTFPESINWNQTLEEKKMEMEILQKRMDELGKEIRDAEDQEIEKELLDDLRSEQWPLV